MPLDGAFAFAAARSTTSAIAAAPAAPPISPLEGVGYTPVVPARLLDTRPGYATVDGLEAGAGIVGPDSTIDVTVLGRGGVPLTGVDSVVVHVTAVKQTVKGFVTVFPSGETRPDSSNVNPIPGSTSSNLVAVRVGVDGKVSLYNSLGTTHLIVDIAGWFPVGPTFTGVTPTRLYDSRTAGTGAKIGPGGVIDVDILGMGGVPASGVSAVALNITGVGATTRTFVTVYPSGTAQPATSSLNTQAGVTGANMVVAQIGGNGKVRLYNDTGNVHLLVDVLGYFSDGPGYTPVYPQRVVDTRTTSPLGPNSTTVFQLSGIGGVPPTGVGAVAFNLTATRQTARTWLTVFPTGSSMPLSSDLNPEPKVVATNLVIGKLGPDGSISLFNKNGTVDVIIDVVGWFPANVTTIEDDAVVSEDDPATAIDVLANDTNHDGGPLTIDFIDPPANGTVVATSTTLTYEPDANYCNSDTSTPDTFTYTLDGGASAVVSVDVTCVDDLPVAVDDTATIAEDGEVVIAVRANDTDIDAGPMTIEDVTQGAHGAVIIDGVSGDPIYTPDSNYCNTPPGTTLDTFTYTLNGGSVATVTVTVDCVDDAPTAVDDALTVSEDANATAVNPLGNDTDVDEGTMEVVSVTQPAAGTVSITGSGVGVSYRPSTNACNTPPGTTPDTFTYTLNGGSVATVTVTVNCVDDAPDAVDDAVTIDEDSAAVLLDLLGNDTDIDGGPMALSSWFSSGDFHGTLTPSGASLTYTPDADFCGVDSFAYVLNGGSTATMDITVTCVDDAPEAVGDVATVDEDSGATTIDVLGNDTDVDAGPMSVTSVTDPAGGTVAITGGGTGLTYEPDPDACNTPPGTTLDTFSYTLSPGGSSATVTVTVNCIDDLPLAVDDTGGMFEDAGFINISVLDNDTDVDGGPKTIATVGTAAHGEATLNGAQISYHSDEHYCGEDTFAYTLNGGSEATVTVTISCVDDEPAAVDDAATVTEDAAATAVAVLGNDTDVDGGPMTISAVTQPTHGTVVITGGGTGLTYEPEANYCNSGASPDDTFTYTLSPGGSSATVSMTVTCVDDAAVAVDDFATITQNDPATAVDVLQNDDDVDGDSFVITAVDQPENGTATITGGGTGLTYEPDFDFCTEEGLSEDFRYTITGGAQAIVHMTVTCLDDPPVAEGDSATVDEDSAATAIDVLANDQDTDGGPISIASVTQPANGTVVITGGGAGLTYEPDANYCNAPPGTTPDSFDYTLTPGSSSATVTLSVTCIDDAPTAVTNSANLTEDASATAIAVLLDDTDVDGGPISIGSVTQSANGTVVITGGGTGLTYEPDANYCNNPPGSSPDVFTYTLSPGGSTASVFVTVNCVDDNPLGVGDSATVTEDSPATAIDVLFNDSDVDAGPKSIASVTQPANGTVVITGGGTGLTYAPNANYCNNPPGTTLDTFTYTLSPGGLSAVVTMTVTCVDDLPVAVDDSSPDVVSVTANEDTVANPAVLANDTDIDGGPKFVASVTQPDNGVVAITGGGTGVSYTPGDDYCNSQSGGTADTFTYTLNGGSSATVSMTVTCVNDAPEGSTTRSFTSVPNMRLTVPDFSGLLLGFSDPDTTVPGTTTTLTISNVSVTSPAGGVVTVDTDGSFTFDAPPGASGDVTFTYQVCDDGSPAPSACSAVVTVTVTLNGEVIWFVDDSAAVTGDGTLNKPFQTLAEATAATDDDESVFLFSGSYTGGQTMDSGGWLIGQPTTGATFDDFFGLVAVPSGVQARPSLGIGSVTVSGQVTLATNAKVRGFALSNNSATALAGASATLVDVDQLTLSATAGANALDLNTVTGTVVIGNLTQTGGTYGVRVQNSSATINIVAGSITNSTTAAVSYTNGAETGSPVFTYAGSISVGSGRAVEISGGTGTPTLNFTGNITATAGSGISMSGTASGSKALFTGVLTLSTGVNGAFSATSGTVEATNTANTLTTTTGTALTVTNATISTGGLAFRSIAAGTVAAGPTNGIVLNNTGVIAGLTVSGTGSAGSGGTIQQTTGAGISLTATRNVSLARMIITDTDGSGINGTGVTNFTFTDGTISNSGDSGIEANIAFNNGTGLGNNIAGTLTVTRSTLTNGFSAGIDVKSDNGTVSNATITNNTITNPGSGTAGISVVGNGTGSTVFNLTRATIDRNNITSAGSAGIQVSIGNASISGPGATAGVLNSSTDIIAITNNGVTLDATGTNAIIVANIGGNPSSRTQTNFLVDCNGLGCPGAPGALNGAANGGTVVLIGNNGAADMSGTVSNNVIDANHNANSGGGNGIGGGNGVGGAGNSWTPSLTLTVINNVITDTDGNGILLVGRGAAGSARFKVQNNVVAAPINVGGTARQGIRIDAGNTSSSDDAVCLNISGNTSAGSNGAKGIGLRKQGPVSNINDFSIHGMAATDSPGVEAYVNSQNAGGGDTDIISAGSGFSNCTLP